MGQLGQTNPSRSQSGAQPGAQQEGPATAPKEAAIELGPKLSPETRCLHSLAINGISAEELKRKFLAVTPAEPVPKYTPDPELPPIGNKIRRLIPDPSKYFSAIPAANDLTTVAHEEYHHVNSLTQNRHAKIASDIYTAAYIKKLEEKIALQKGPIEGLLELTPAEQESLPNPNCFSIYLPEFDSSVTIHEPRVLKAAARKFIPDELWGESAKLYVEKMKETNRFSSHLFDEGMAYVVDGQTALSLIQDCPSRLMDDPQSRFDTLRRFYRDRNPLTNSASRLGDPNPFSSATSTGLELAVSLLAHAKAVQEKEPAYFNSSGYKELCAYIVKENIRTYEAGAVFPVFRSKETETYYKALMSETAGKELRTFARAAFGEQWYSDVFSKKSRQNSTKAE